MNDFQRSYFGQRKMMIPNYQQKGIQRFLSIGGKRSSQTNEVNAKDIENIFNGEERREQSEFSSVESSISSDIKEKKRSIVRDMEMSMLMGMSRNDGD